MGHPIFPLICVVNSGGAQWTEIHLPIEDTFPQKAAAPFLSSELSGGGNRPDPISCLLGEVKAGYAHLLCLISSIECEHLVCLWSVSILSASSHFLCKCKLTVLTKDKSMFHSSYMLGSLLPSFDSTQYRYIYQSARFFLVT